MALLIIGDCQPALIQQHWPLFTPVLLALVENESIDVKSRGLEILASFVAKCPGQVLQNTGIGRVFEDATFPMLLYLPSVTPEEQSTAVLSPAYDVLTKLAESSEGFQNPERRRLLDKALRDGIFAGHFHASQYSRIVQVLMQKTASIVNCLGIYSIKHLKVRRLYNVKKTPPDRTNLNKEPPLNDLVDHDRSFRDRASAYCCRCDTSIKRHHCQLLASNSAN